MAKMAIFGKKGVPKKWSKKWSKMSSEIAIFRVLLGRGKPEKGGLRVEVFSSVKLIGGYHFGPLGPEVVPSEKGVFWGVQKVIFGVFWVIFGDFR
jgi:hypothetical protein